MKKLTKKIISLFAGITFAISFLFGASMLTNPMKANAEETLTIDSSLRVQMKEGAAVRIGTTPETGDQAIRFQTYVKKSYFDTLVNPETGIYVIPKDLLTGELTNETPMAKRIPSQVCASESDTHYLYNSVLYDIPENSYGRDIVARAYVKSGSTYVWAGNAQVRSLSYVASAALEDGKDASGEAFGSTEILYLQNYVDKALKSFSVNDDSYTMTVGETLTVSTTITPVYAEDDLSNLKVIYSTDNQAVVTVENGALVAKSAGVAMITAKLGSRTDTFTVFVKGENQDLFMTNSNWSLDVSIPTGYNVTSITCDGENWGTNPASLAIADTLVADTTKHGEKVATVNVSNGSKNYAIEIPVTLVTDVISSAADFAKVQVANTSSAIYGYYVLTGDITGGITAGGGGRMQPTDDGVNGFRGTFDGRGHTITSNSLGGGLFCALGRDAVIKNTTFICNSIAQNGWASFLACYAIGAKVEDVTFNFSGITGADAGKKGLIFEMGARDCAFNNVIVNITGNASTLFGGHTNNYIGFNANQHNFWNTKCTFTNTTINLMTADSSLSMLGEGWIASAAWSGTGTVTQFIADGCTTAAGATTERVEGVTISKVEVRTETLDYTQEIYLMAKLQMIDLGEYADYAIASIKLGNYNFGTNPAKLAVSDAFKADKANHGEQNLIIEAQKGADKVELIVPVIFVTDTVSTMEQLLALQPKNYNTCVYGYYVLTDDIGSLDTAVKGYEMNVDAESNNGFMGTIDGRGHTISLTVANATHQFGLFAKLKNATIRNVTFDCADMYTLWATALLARTITNTKFENTTFNFRNVTVTDGGTTYGLLAEYGLLNSTFDNVHFIVNADKPMSLLGARYLGFEGNIFTDCTVSLLGAELNQIGHTANGTVYTTYDGITIQDVVERVETLSYTQDIVMTTEKPALNLGAYADYDISSIAYGDYDLGTDINALAISNALREDFQNHGVGKTIVVKASKYADVVSINVPVTFITFKISTANDFKAVQLSQDNVQEEIYGYYVLANDITSTSALVAGGQDSNDAAKDGTWGFRGTLDGRNHTITAPASSRGLFGAMGSGAVVKDLTFTIPSINQAEWAVSVLGRSVVGVKFENVVFNVSNITTDNVKGLIGERTVRDCDFINVDFNVDGVVKQLFPSGINNWIGFNANQQNYPNTLCTFTNCTLNLLTADSSVGMLGAGYDGSKTVTYQPTGVELKDGEQVVGGITLRDNTTGTYLLRNNTSPYTIVVPAMLTTELGYAKDELIRFFKEATGVTLEAITDTYLTHTTDGTYISLGTTKAATTAGLSVPTLKRDGAYIKTQDKTIYILGGSDVGVLNGVYTFLGELFGYEQYYKDCYALDTSLKVIELSNYNITNNPDIDYRGSGGITYTFGMKDGYVATTDDTMYSYRLGSTDAYWRHIMPVIHAADSSREAADHNSLYYFPVSMYKESNPEFYSNNSTFDENSWGGINAQLCYTARGNAAGTYNMMTTLAAERIQASLIKNVGNKQYTTVQLGMEDCYQTCTCAGCNAIISQYGAISATVIIFLNDVAVKVNNWMASNPQYARDLQYMFFAYNEFQRPPTTFPAISDGVKIVPFVALSHIDYDKAINDTTTRNTTALGTISNNMLYGWLKTWGDFAKENGSKAWAWSYGAFIHDYFVFVDSYTFYGQFFKALNEYGYEMAIVQQHSAQRGADTAFFAMNLYLTNALAWDSSLDINTLIDNYMEAMYMDAADEMKSLFAKWKSIYASRLSNVESANGKPASKLNKSDVDALFDILDSAYEAIAHYETTNPALYAKLKAHIDMEWLAPAKLAVTGSFAWRYKLSGDYNTIASKFETLCDQFGIVALGERATIDSTIEGL